MTINGGTFTGDIKNCIYKGDDGSINNISGGTFSGAAACVLQNVNEMTISGGDFTNNNSGYPVINNQYYDDEIDKGVVTIEGGNFTSADENSPLFENGDNSTIEISGGSYSLEPDEEFIVDGIGFNQQDNNRWEIDAPEEPETLPTVTEEQNPATADDKFHACYEDIKTLLDKAEEQSPEAKQLIRDEIAFYLANFLYLYHRDAFSKDKE